MIRTAIAATTLLLAAVPAAAQSQQDALDARYNRALAAGYKALMLCSAISTSEATGVAARTPDSVHDWELTGVQQPIDGVIRDLPYRVVRQSDAPGAAIQRVEVTWADDMPPRFAEHLEGEGCLAAPLGADPDAWAIAHVPPERPLSSAAALPDPRASPVRAVREAAFGETYGKGARTTVVLITKDGQPVDWGAVPGFSIATPQRTWSVAKSIAATLVGAAVQRGEADVTASAGLGLSEDDPRRAITIDHLLRMASGRYSDTPGNRTDPLYYGGATVEEVALDWPLVTAPGTTYRYANNDTLAAVAAIKRTFAAHPPAEFFARLGMTGTVAETDWQGDYILSSQVWTTASDLAKLGELYFNDGKLPDGTRILPEGWVKYVTTPSGPQPPTGTFGYGAGFWLLNREEGVPPDTFAALGNRGQHVVIVPSRKVVIVRRGEDPVGAGFDIAAFTRDVLAALPPD